MWSDYGYYKAIKCTMFKKFWGSVVKFYICLVGFISLFHMTGPYFVFLPNPIAATESPDLCKNTRQLTYCELFGKTNLFQNRSKYHGTILPQLKELLRINLFKTGCKMHLLKISMQNCFRRLDIFQILRKRYHWNTWIIKQRWVMIMTTLAL